MQRKRNVPDSERKQTTAFDCGRMIKIPENGHYFYDQFLRDDAETLTNYICQFDFMQSLPIC